MRAWKSPRTPTAQAIPTSRTEGAAACLAPGKSAICGAFRPGLCESSTTAVFGTPARPAICGTQLNRSHMPTSGYLRPSSSASLGGGWPRFFRPIQTTNEGGGWPRFFRPIQTTNEGAPGPSHSGAGDTNRHNLPGTGAQSTRWIPANAHADTNSRAAAKRRQLRITNGRKSPQKRFFRRLFDVFVRLQPGLRWKDAGL